MIKLENPTNQSAGDVPAIVLSAEPASRPPVAGSRDWTEDTTRMKQTNDGLHRWTDGQPFELSGIVPESAAITISGAFKVVVEVNPSNRLRTAYEAGNVSKEDAVLELVKVLEVWANPTKCLFGGDRLPAASRAVRSMDGAGKIS